MNSSSPLASPELSEWIRRQRRCSSTPSPPRRLRVAVKVEKVVLYPITSQRTQSDYKGREGGPPSHHFPEDAEWIWRQRKRSSTPSPPRGPSSPKEQLVSSREGLEKQAGILRSGRLCPSTAFFSTLVFPCHLVCGWARSGAELVLTRADKGVAATPPPQLVPSVMLSRTVWRTRSKLSP